MSREEKGGEPLTLAELRLQEKVFLAKLELGKARFGVTVTDHGGAFQTIRFEEFEEKR